MKTFNENWQEMFIDDELDQTMMFKIRGGGDPDDEDPDDPILK